MAELSEREQISLWWWGDGMIKWVKRL